MRVALLADRDPLARTFVASLLAECGFSDLRHASSFGEVLQALGESSGIALLVVDFDLPAMSAEVGLKHLRSLLAGRALVVLTAMDQATARQLGKRLEAEAVISKQLPTQDLARALNAVTERVSSESALPAAEAAARIDALQPDLFGHKLTVRQSAVLDLMVDGRSNREIADALGISEGTVKAHIIAAFRILGVHNRLSAVAAYRKSRVEPETEPGDYLM